MALVVDYKDVSIYQEDKCILEHVNLAVEEGTFVYLTGMVGSGKSTLLKSMYGELSVSSGEGIVLGEYNMDKKLKDRKRQELRRKLGIVFQDFQLLGDRTVAKNLEFVLRATGWKKKADIENLINEVLQLVEMSQMKDKRPNELSGGEQQRICIARAILNNPKLILADEPTGNLDVVTGKKILELLYSISKNGSTVIMSTHNLSLINAFPGLVYKVHEKQFTDVTEEFNRPIDMSEID